MFVLMTVNELHKHFLKILTPINGEREADVISDWVFESVTGMKRTQRLIKKNEIIDSAIQETLLDKLEELKTNKPVQYVLGESFFYKMKFKINESALIPRPETEELVEWVCQYVKENNLKDPSIIDIGTGSGCIPIAIKKNLASAHVEAIEVSKEALYLAKENAYDLKANVIFHLVDFLNNEHWPKLDRYDIIVSNPPYIPVTEKDSLNKNVVTFEPHVALFVPNDDPVIFYRKIEEFAGEHLEKGGSVFAEIHESYAELVSQIFDKPKWQFELRQDMYGRNRMIKASSHF